MFNRKYGIYINDVQRSLISINEARVLQPRSLRTFTKENIDNVNKVWSSFFQTRSFGTNETNYGVIDNALTKDIIQIINKNNFYLIYGNSGRGKSFFVFNLIKSMVLLYDIVMYYTPQLSTGEETIDSTLTFLECSLQENKRIFLIVDDCHLADNLLKQNLFSEFDQYLSMLFVSRDRQEGIIPNKYLNDDFFINFNKVAEYTFTNILEKFYKQNSKYINFSQKIEEDLKRETESSNLVFLTLFLQSWEELLKSEREVSINEIRNNSYRKFLTYYDSDLNHDWRYINNIVSALFQYEIRIDKRYLSIANHNLYSHNLESYINDRMVHSKVVTEEGENRLFYVFMDFKRGEEHDMMKHASEFRFYLEAYGRNLTFDTTIDPLSRLDFTLLVIKDYLLSSPINPQEVLERIKSNAGREEQKFIFASLFRDENMIPYMIR